MIKLDSLMREAMDTEDPLERARILNKKVLPALHTFRETVITQRALSVKEACDFGNDGGGFTYSQIARKLGVSKPLVQQMVSLAREIHTLRMNSKAT